LRDVFLIFIKTHIIAIPIIDDIEDIKPKLLNAKDVFELIDEVKPLGCKNINTNDWISEKNKSTINEIKSV
tara:strand:+ start:574 stop:786 length:213 start_codon:yes stop_codon:yes gene_type:complete